MQFNKYLKKKWRKEVILYSSILFKGELFDEIYNKDRNTSYDLSNITRTMTKIITDAIWYNFLEDVRGKVGCVIYRLNDEKCVKTNMSIEDYLYKKLIGRYIKEERRKLMKELNIRIESLLKVVDWKEVILG